jgi:hypothetical protein
MAEKDDVRELADRICRICHDIPGNEDLGLFSDGPDELTPTLSAALAKARLEEHDKLCPCCSSTTEVCLAGKELRAAVQEGETK